MKLKKLVGIALAVLMSVSVLAGCKPPQRDDNVFLTEALTADPYNHYSRFTESWRSVKQEGWAINKTLLEAGNEAKLNRALKLFDYLYSKEGNRIMSYGPDAWVDGTITYGGKEVPKLSAAALAELQELEKGNYTNYYRNWLGGTMPVGYVKEQGMEFQTVHAKGKTGLENILTAVNLGTMDHLQVSSADNFVWTDEVTTTLNAAAPSSATVLNMAVLYQGPSKIIFNPNIATGSSGGNGAAFADATKTNGNGSWTGADGHTYGLGELKPVWRALGTKLNITFQDATGTQTSVSSCYSNLAGTNYNGQKNNFDIITGGATDIVRDGINGMFINLLDYIDQMPNMKRFLEANPFVKASCLAGNNAMYYAPYFDGFDDIERMFMLRKDWVEKLLDGTPTLDTAKTLDEVAYTPFMPETMNQKFTVVNADGSATTQVTKKYSKNIITVQNELATKNGATLTNALRDYIDSTYGSFYGEKRSELFTGVNAAYDADELIALFRCVRTNPALLNGNANADIVPYYPRFNTADRLMDLYRLMSIWGVRGLEARNNFFFVDEEGQLRDSRLEPKTLAGLEKLNQLYKEKLILQNFDNAAAVDTSITFNSEASFRHRLNAQNRGFMTYDYNQTSTVVNGLDAEIAGFYFTPVLPPFSDWGFRQAPDKDNKTFISVPTSFGFDTATQALFDSYTNMNGSDSKFYINSNNGKSGDPALSNVAWSDAIIQGFGQDYTKGTVVYNFSSKSAFLTQVKDTWSGDANLSICNLAFQSFYTKYQAAKG